MSRRPGRRRAAAGMACVLAFVAAAAALRPPVFAVRAAVEHFLPPPAVWSAVGRSDGRYHVDGLSWPADAVTLTASRLTLTRVPWACIVSGAWPFEAENAKAVPSDPRWPSLEFGSGKGRWIARSRKLELREWTSPAVFLNADVAWDASGRVDAGRIWGEADTRELARALARWKVLEPDSGEGGSARKAFEFIYARESLLIRVNGKPFFKATWRSGGSF